MPCHWRSCLSQPSTMDDAEEMPQPSVSYARDTSKLLSSFIWKLFYKPANTVLLSIELISLQLSYFFITSDITFSSKCIFLVIYHLICSHIERSIINKETQKRPLNIVTFQIIYWSLSYIFQNNCWINGSHVIDIPYTLFINEIFHLYVYVGFKDYVNKLFIASPLWRL